MIVRGTIKAVQRELWSRNHRSFVTVILPHRELSCGETTKCLNLKYSSTRKFSTQSHEMVKARKYVLVKHFTDKPKPTDLKLVEEELPALKNGGREN